MTSPAAPRAASDVTAMLRRHYLPEGRPPGGIFAPEIGSPCGKRRADLIWLPTTISGGRGMVGHEIKVTRADVLAELADPSKADPWAKYCSRWWLVVADLALVDGLALPEAWGVMAPPSGRRTRSMTIVRPAPKLDPVDRTPGLERLTAWMHYRGHEKAARLRMDLESAERRIKQLEAQADTLRVSGGVRDPRADRIARIVRLVDEATKWESASDQEIAAAVMDAHAVKRAADTMRWDMQALINAADTLVAPLAHLKKDLAKLGVEAKRIAS